MAKLVGRACFTGIVGILDSRRTADTLSQRPILSVKDEAIYYQIARSQSFSSATFIGYVQLYSNELINTLTEFRSLS